MVAKTDKDIHLEGIGDVTLADTPSQEDHLAKFLITPKEHVEMLPPRERLAIAFQNRKHDKLRFAFPKPVPRKYPTPLHKRLAKLDIEFEKASPLRQVRLLKWAMSVTERLEIGRSKHRNRMTHKAFRNQGKFEEIVKEITKEEKTNGRDNTRGTDVSNGQKDQPA